MTAEPVVGGVYQIGPGYVNSFILDGDEGVVLVDTLLPNKEDMIAEGLSAIGRSFGDVKAILITHSHGDHSGSAAAVKAEAAADLYASEADAPAIRGDVKPPSPPTPLYVKPLAFVMSLMPGPPPVEVNHFVSEDDGNPLPADLRAIDTPGHTPGHTSFLLDRAGGVLFVGDAAKATRGGRVIRGYFNRAMPSIDNSLRHLAEFEFEVAVFGHSRPIRAGASTAFRRFSQSLTRLGG